MLEKLLLYQLLINVVGNRDVVDQHYPLTIKKTEIMQEFSRLRADQNAAVREFLLNQKVREATICFLSYYASCRVENDLLAWNLEMLVDQFNSRFVNKLGLVSVDVYRIGALLDVVGDAIHLGDNSNVPYMSWPSFLCAVGIRKHCSVFDEAYDTPGKIHLSLPERAYVPIQWYTALLSDKETSEFIADLMKHGCRNKKREKADKLLLGVIWYAPSLEKNVNKVLKRLFSKAVPEYLINTLAFFPENADRWEACCGYIEKVHGQVYSQTFQEIVKSRRERINRSLGIGR